MAMKPKFGERGIAKRPMHFIWIVDCSSSMGSNGKIESLNHAIRDALPEMKRLAEDNPFVEILVRVVRFSTGARWHVAEPIDVADFQWSNIEVDGGITDMGAALSMIAPELSVERMGTRGYPPVLVLISDGQPTDDHRSGIRAVMQTPWGRRACRIAIAIGRDAVVEPLEEFMGNLATEFPVLRAENPDQLVAMIRFVTVAVSRANSRPTSQAEHTGSSNIQLPQPPDESDAPVADVW